MNCITNTNVRVSMIYNSLPNSLLPAINTSINGLGVTVKHKNNYIDINGINDALVTGLNMLDFDFSPVISQGLSPTDIINGEFSGSGTLVMSFF